MKLWQTYLINSDINISEDLLDELLLIDLNENTYLEEGAIQQIIKLIGKLMKKKKEFLSKFNKLNSKKKKAISKVTKKVNTNKVRYQYSKVLDPLEKQIKKTRSKINYLKDELEKLKSRG